MWEAATVLPSIFLGVGTVTA